MTLLSAAAIYFIVWWTVLFVVLPFGHRSQEEDGAVVAGTVESAPVKFHGLRVVLVTTLISALLVGGSFWLLQWSGLGISDLPVILPDAADL